MERGAQLGNNNATKAKPWADAVRSALIKYEEHPVQRGQALEKIAHKVVKMALEGDHMAIAEIANRLDGKPRQEVDATVDGSLEVRIIRFTVGEEPKLVQHEPELIEQEKA